MGENRWPFCSLFGHHGGLMQTHAQIESNSERSHEDARTSHGGAGGTGRAGNVVNLSWSELGFSVF